MEIGTLITSLVTGEALGAFFSMIGSWLSREKNRSVTLEIDGKKLVLSDIKDKDQQELLAWFKQQTGYNWTG